ncbi:MAG: substrate-binding domain-containing protein [Pirellulales bacterium]
MRDADSTDFAGLPSHRLLPAHPRVTVLVPAHSGWGRGVIKGIAAFANRHGPWQLHVDAEGEKRILPRGWQGDGVIARVSTPSVARELTMLKVPLVNVSAIRIDVASGAIPRVCNDLRACGTLAARHLLDRGLRHFGYVGLPKLSYVQEHRDAFAATIGANGFECHTHTLGADDESTRKAGRLTAWLRSLPRPVGILTWANAQGRAVIDACRRAHLLVPEDVAILSGDDDHLLCESCLPTLSAIGVAAEQIGIKAAELLHLQLLDRPLPPSPIAVVPLGIVTRQSTDIFAIDNHDLLRVLGFIRENASKPIRVDDVLEAVPISRRTLERLFQDQLGRTPAEEIRRVRLERAKHLLATTDLAVPKVAEACGFGTGEYLATVFRQAVGMTPLKYRAAAAASR